MMVVGLAAAAAMAALLPAAAPVDLVACEWMAERA